MPENNRTRKRASVDALIGIAALLAAGGLILFLLFTSGVITLPEAGEKTITLTEANKRADEYIEQVHASVMKGLRLTKPERDEAFPCLDPTDGGSEERRIASRDYQLVDFDRADIPQYFEKLRSWWTQHEFRVLRNESKEGYLWGESRKDAFRMALQSNDLGEMYLSVSSPCVWPNGTPEPS